MAQQQQTTQQSDTNQRFLEAIEAIARSASATPVPSPAPATAFDKLMEKKVTTTATVHPIHGSGKYVTLANVERCASRNVALYAAEHQVPELAIAVHELREQIKSQRTSLDLDLQALQKAF